MDTGEKMKGLRRAWSELSESVLEYETFAPNAQSIPAELDLQRKISEIMSGLRPPPESYDDGDQSPLSGDDAQFLRNQWSTGMDYVPYEPMFPYLSPWLKAVFSGDFDSVMKMLEGKSDAEIKRMIAKRETLMNVSALFHVIVGARTLAESHPKLEEVQKLSRRHLNVKNDHLKILEKLLSLGANVNIRDVAGFTPLHYCAQFHGNKTTTKMAGILIKAGANIDAQNRFGATALLDATHCNHYDMVKVLSESGADFFIKDNNGISPFSLSSGNLKTSKMFSEERKKRASQEREKLREEAGGSFSKCSVCKRTENTKRCSGCYFVWYCGRRCQKEHWPRHQEECKAVQKEYMECVTADHSISILTASNKTYTSSEKNPARRQFVVKVQIPMRGFLQTDTTVNEMGAISVQNKDKTFIKMLEREENQKIHQILMSEVKKNGVNGLKGYFFAFLDSKQKLKINPFRILPPETW